MNEHVKSMIKAGERYTDQMGNIIHANEDKKNVGVELCGKRFKHYYSPVGEHIQLPLFCRQYEICEDCCTRKASDDRLRVVSNVVKYTKDNPDLKLRYKANVSYSQIGALQKRIARHGGLYHRSHNEDGTCNYFILAEDDSDFGDPVERKAILSENGDVYDFYDLDTHDWKEAVKVHKRSNKRQSGALFAKAEKEESEEGSYKLRVPVLKVVKPSDESKLSKIMDGVKPLTYVQDEKEHQQAIYNLIHRANMKATAQGIDLTVSMEFRNATPKHREMFNKKVNYYRFLEYGERGKCPDKIHKEVGGGYPLCTLFGHVAENAGSA